MERPRIPIAGPWISDKEINYAAEAAASAWYEDAGSYTRRFEREFATYLGAQHAIAVPHCTAAIHLSLVALGIAAGDEVVVPELTWIATSAPIEYVGATPVFADVDPATWCLDPESFRRCISPRTKAVIPVDLYGGMPEMEEVVQIARAHGIAVIEDAAEAIGSELWGRKAGSWGDTGVFSFHGSKTMTTGEGGMLVTSNDRVYERAMFLRDHGRTPGDVTFCNEEVGFKYRMSDVQAAIGLAQLERIEELVARKKEIFAWYLDELGDCDGLSWNPEPPGVSNSLWMTTVLFPDQPPIDKRSVTDWLAQRGVATRPFFEPLSSLPAYGNAPTADSGRANNRAAYAISKRGFNLPSALRMCREDVKEVAAAVREFLEIERWRSIDVDSESALEGQRTVSKVPDH